MRQNDCPEEVIEIIFKLDEIGRKHFPALEKRDYRIFFFGQCFSLIGTWMQSVGQSWLVYQLTDSPFLLGSILALQFLPVLLFSLFAGALIDRLPKKKIFMMVQTFMMLNAFTLTVIVMTGNARYWNIAVLAFVLGLLNCVDMPIRQSVMVEWAGREHLMNAISLNATIFNAARIIGPAIAGVVFSLWGPAICFFLNGLSFLPIIVGTFFMKSGSLVIRKESVTSLKADIMEGVNYIKEHPKLLLTLIIIGFISTFGLNFNVVVPVVSKEMLLGDSSTYGFLMAALGCGAFIGAFRLAATSYRGFRLNLIFLCFGGLGLVLIFLSFASIFFTAMIAMVIMGFCMSTGLSSSNTFLQLNSPDELRGRIMSVYSLVLGGVTPVGSLYAGYVCDQFGVRTFLILSGAITIAVMSFFFIKFYSILNKRAESTQ